MPRVDVLFCNPRPHMAGGHGEEQEDPAGQEGGLRPQGCRGEWAIVYTF